MPIWNDCPAMADVISGIRPKPLEWSEAADHRQWMRNAPCCANRDLRNAIAVNIEDDYLLAHPWPSKTYQMLRDMRDVGLPILIRCGNTHIAANEDGTRFSLLPAAPADFVWEAGI